MFFFFNDTATTEIYTLSLHDALPICLAGVLTIVCLVGGILISRRRETLAAADRKSTRLNSSHLVISYAVFCLKKKTNFVAAEADAKRTPHNSSPLFIPSNLLH